MGLKTREISKRDEVCKVFFFSFSFQYYLCALTKSMDVGAYTISKSTIRLYNTYSCNAVCAFVVNFPHFILFIIDSPKFVLHVLMT